MKHNQLRALWLVWLGLFLASGALAQTSITTSSSATSGCATIVTDTDKSTVGIQVTGTWTGTLQPQVAIQGQAAVNTQVTPTGSSTPQSTITANGLFTASVAGTSTFQICGPTGTGTALVWLNVSKAAVKVQGGSGSGTVSANNGSAGAVANYAAAGGSTTVGPDATLTDNGTNLTYTGTTIVAPAGSTSNSSITYGSGGVGHFQAAANVMGVQLGAATSTQRFLNGATVLGTLNFNATQSIFQTAPANTTLAVAGGVTTSTAIPSVLIGSEGGGNLAFTATSSNQIGVQFGNGTTSGMGALRFAPTSGTATFQFAKISGQINQTGGANGTVTDFLVSTTETALVGAHNAIDVGTGGSGGNFTVTAAGKASPKLYGSITACASSGGTCSAAPAGFVSIAAAATTVTVSTTAVTANSQIFIQEDATLGTALSVTCNTTTGRLYTITTRTANTSFVITASAAPAANPACLSYHIMN